MTLESDHHAHAHGPELIRMLDLDALVQAPMIDEAVGIAATLAGVDTAGRILDIGAGTGTGTIALARRFVGADIVAVDIDDRMLARVRERARAEGLHDRVTTTNADVASEAPALGTADLVWSSASIHEVSDADRAFRNLFESVLTGGHLVVIEMDAPPRVLPAALDGLEDRLRAASGLFRAADHPDWAAGMEAAGFESLFTRTLTTDRVMPADGPAGDYAALELRRTAHGAMDALAESDREALETLLGEGPGSVRELGELRIRATRTLWAARRP